MRKDKYDEKCNDDHGNNSPKIIDSNDNEERSQLEYSNILPAGYKCIID